MILTILEAHVKEKYWQELPKIYRDLAIDKPEGLVQSYLAQDKKQLDVWRILTFWQSQEALDAMRATGRTPTGVAIFQRVQAEPTLQTFEIKQAKD